MTTNHKPATPLPWAENWNNPRAGWIEGAGQQVIVLTGQQDGQDDDDANKDAAYIVHAANAYPRLVAALRQAKDELRNAARFMPTKTSAGVTDLACDEYEALLRELGEG